MMNSALAFTNTKHRPSSAQRAERDQDRPLRPYQIVHPGEGHGPEARHHVERNAEIEDFFEAHAEGAGCIEPSEGKKSVQVRW